MSVYRPRDRNGKPKSPYLHFDFTVTVAGERRRVSGSTGETTRARAREYERKERQRTLDGEARQPMTLAAACHRYYAEVARHQPSREATLIALDHCCRLFGDNTPLVRITGDRIATAVRTRAGEAYGKHKQRVVSAATVNRQIVEPIQRVLRRAARLWGEDCRPDKIDWAGLRLREPQGRERELLPHEADAFWAALRTDYYPLVWFLAHRGLRVRAALGMTRANVDLVHGRARVWIKGSGHAWVPLTREQIGVVATEIERSPCDSVWTFVGQRGRPKGARRRSPMTGCGA